MSDQSDTDMDTSAVTNDQTHAATPTPMLVDTAAHSEAAEKPSAPGESLLFFPTLLIVVYRSFVVTLLVTSTQLLHVKPS